MDRHSTLELVKHDETANAPERDWDATAFELDASVLAPQVVVDATPQVACNDSSTEVHNPEESTKEHAPSPHPPKLTIKRSLMITLLVVAVVVAIGVGVGIWHRRKNAPQGSSTINSPPAPRPTTPNHTQYILNDTSLAALVLPGGDRQLFFQANNGSIRRAIRTASDNQWTISPYLNLSSNPKSHSPLAAEVSDEVFDQDSSTIGLQYVSESHILISGYLQQGDWEPDINFGNWSTAVDTRSLSVCSLPLPPGAENGTDSVVSLALLIYESPTRKVSALLQRENTSLDRGRMTEWVDITNQESNLLPEFSAPFTIAANFSFTDVGLLLYSPDSGSPIVEFYSDISRNGPGTFEPGGNTTIIGSHDYSSLHQSDIATFGLQYFIWVNGTNPVAGSLDLTPETPKMSFPFARLASATYQSMTYLSTTYLYHQINGTTFAEEQWDEQEGTWTTDYIHVSDLDS